MDVTYSHCAGLDVHKKTVVACCLVREGNSKTERQTRTFSTMSQDLLALSDWLSSHAITRVAMESTGKYWKPVYNILEGNCLGTTSRTECRPDPQNLEKKGFVWKRTRRAQRGRQNPEFKAIKQADLAMLRQACADGYLELKYLAT